MPKEMIGRRVSSMAEIERAGDYWYDPEGSHTDGKPMVAFLLPIARDEHVPNPGARSIHHVCSPPHVFRECADGSIEVRESIGAYGWSAEGYVWHGYLDEGHRWRSC